MDEVDDEPPTLLLVFTTVEGAAVLRTRLLLTEAEATVLPLIELLSEDVVALFDVEFNDEVGRTTT